MFAFSVEDFLRSLGVPRDLRGILNVKSHSRKEGRKEELFVQIRKINIQDCHPRLLHLRSRIYILQDTRTLYKFCVVKFGSPLENVSLCVTSLKMSQIIPATGKQGFGRPGVHLPLSRLDPTTLSLDSLALKLKHIPKYIANIPSLLKRSKKNAKKYLELIMFFPRFLPSL